MKKIFNVILVAAVVILFSSCYGRHLANTNNVNNNVTNVVLQSNNYRVVSKVTGRAEGTIILGLGGSFRPLIENARSDMLRSANLIGSSRALINEVVEFNTRMILFNFVVINSVTVSAYVIEFTH